MKKFQAGEFERENLHGLLQPFCPTAAFHDLLDIDLEALKRRGKKLILLDVDNTIVLWKTEDFSEEVLGWLKQARDLGFELCIVSNTRNPERLGRLSEKLAIPTVRGKFKPSRTMFRMAMEKFNVSAAETIMVGDQIFTDILGANRSGIEAVWVQQLSPREFHGTRHISRRAERLIQGWLYRALETPVDQEPGPAEVEGKKPFLERTLVRQVVKFVVVGGTSFIIDLALRILLIYGLDPGPNAYATNLGIRMQEAMPGLFRWLINTFPSNFSYAEPHKNAMPLLIAVAASMAMLNSFFWNRRWTFKVTGAQHKRQLKRFMLISWIGFFMNLLISSSLAHIIKDYDRISMAVATVIAAGIVSVWNFTGQRLYAFKSEES